MLNVLLGAERVADGVTLRLQEREGHRPADQDRVGDLQEALDHLDLVAHLGAAEDRHERTVGRLDQLEQRAHLAFQQQPCGPRLHQLRGPHGRGVRAVRGAEGVVDVDIGERRERRRELRIVLSLARLVTDVLEHQDLPGLELVSQLGDLVAGDRGRHLHGHSEQLAQALGDRRQRQLGLTGLGPAQM